MEIRTALALPVFLPNMYPNFSLLTAVAEGFAAVVLGFLSAYVGYGCAAWLFPEGSAARRLAAGVIVWEWSLMAIFNLLAWFSAFRLPMALTCLAGAAALVWILRQKAFPRILPVSDALTEDLKRFIERLRQTKRTQAFPLIVILGTATLVVGFRAITGFPFTIDSLTYHLFHAGKFVQEGGGFELNAPGIWGFSYQYYPPGGEILAAWLMLPFHGDLVVALRSLPLWCLCLTGAYETGRRLGLPSRRALIPALLIGFSPAVFPFLAASYVDIPLLGSLLGAVPFFLEAVSSGCVPSMFVLAAAVGCAMGIKVFALPAVGVTLLLLAVSFVIREGINFRWPLRWIVVVGIIFASGGSSYLQTWIHRGSPLWPLPLRIVGITFFQAGEPWVAYLGHLSRLLESIFPGRSPFSEVLSMVTGTFGFEPLALGPVFLIAIFLVPLGCVRCWKTDQRWFLIFTALFLAAFGAGYTSSVLWRFHLLYVSVNARLITFPASLVMILAFAGMEGFVEGIRQRLLLFMAVLGTIAFAVTLPISGSTGFRLLDVVLVAIVLASPILARMMMPALMRAWAGCISAGIPVLAWKSALVLSLGLGLGLLPFLKSPFRHIQLKSAFEAYDCTRKVVEAWNLCDEPGTSKRIAFSAGWDRMMGHNWLWYPLLGRRLQNDLTYIPISADGGILEYSDSDKTEREGNFTAWLKRLREKQIDTLALFPPDPPEFKWALEHPEIFQPLGTASPTQVFRILP